jgi:two-component system nitrogen regulation response regulator NtrX
MYNGKSKVLVVDDDPRARDTLINVLSSENYITFPAEDGESAIEMVKNNDINLVLLDLMLPDLNGIDVLKSIKELKPALPVIMISGLAQIQDAVQATKHGAYDFLEKSSFDKDKFLTLIRNALEKERMERQITLLKDEILKRYQMIGGASQNMAKVFDLIEKSAPTRASVLITGESGVGKELVARAIHNRSERKDNPFIKINCAAMPDTLLESELFGFEKGAFTDAKAQKKGKLEIADGGTLFLDEVGDMSLSAQAKLLRFLQEGEFERLGSTNTFKVDVRVITATNKNLRQEIQEQRFREDLYYRLNVINIFVPSLRDRKDDIPALADFFIADICEAQGIPQKSLTQDAVEFLQNQQWKGNIRELRNVIERAVILIKNIEINASDLSKVNEDGACEMKQEHKTLRDARDDFERRYILQLLSKHNWNMTKTAEILQIDRAHLYRKLKELNIEENRRKH